MSTHSFNMQKFRSQNKLIPKKLVIIGNGFDLNLKMKSCFKDFINDKYQDTQEILNRKKHELSIRMYNLNTFESLELPILYMRNKFIPTVLMNNIYNNLLDSLYKCKNKNFWVQYLLIRKLIFNNKVNEWNDIETSMYDFFSNSNHSLLDYITNVFESSIIKSYYNTGIKFKNYLKWIQSKYQMDNDTFCEMFLISSIISYNLSHNKCGHNAQYLSNLIRSFAEKHNNTVDHAAKTDFNPLKDYRMLEESQKNEIRNIIINYLRDELEDFEHEFNNYMLEQEQSNLYQSNSNKLLKRIVDNNVFCMLDFNYTTPNIDALNCINIAHIHGKLVDSKKFSDTKNTPIIGIDSSDIPLNQNEYIFTKTFRIISSETIKEFHKFLSPTINEIFIFGHSLSDSDYIYFEQIFNYYDIYDLKTKITLCFSPYDEKSDDEIKRELLSSFSKLLDRYCEHNGNKNSNNLLLKLSGNDKLSFKKV